MGRKTLGPFLELANFPPVDVLTVTPSVIAAAMQRVHDALEANGCLCTGASRRADDPNRGTPRDPDWGDDISELVARSAPHEIYGIDANGQPTTETVRVKLDTLRVEVDDNREICCWLYEESPA